MMPDFYPGGFPHSDICGSMDICSYPQLFAACHVLLRLLMPSHPPYALLSLTFSSCLSFGYSLAFLRFLRKARFFELYKNQRYYLSSCLKLKFYPFRKTFANLRIYSLAITNLIIYTPCQSSLSTWVCVYIFRYILVSSLSIIVLHCLVFKVQCSVLAHWKMNSVQSSYRDFVSKCLALISFLFFILDFG